MKIYIVGGAVRDFLLGRPQSDRDYVVVSASPKEMLAQGFRPVGKDFPVFLHPKTQAEYALARTERKTAPGYHGFQFHASPEVSLEEDLARRDLTINAMACPDGELCAQAVIDPYHGVADLQLKVFRHVSPAFAEDPVRILRIARFAARFPDFRVAPETLNLMRQMVNDGEVDALVAERVWQELAKGLMETHPSRMLQVLRDCGALKRLLPEIDALYGIPQRADYHPEIDTGIHVEMVIDASAKLGFTLPVRFAALTHDLGKAKTPQDLLPAHHGHEHRGLAPLKAICERFRVPIECAELARLTTEFHGLIHSAGSHREQQLRPETVLGLLEKTDAFRRPERFERLLEACECDAKGRLGREDYQSDANARLRSALNAANQINAGEIASACNDKTSIPSAIRQARLAIIKIESASHINSDSAFQSNTA